MKFRYKDLVFIDMEFFSQSDVFEVIDYEETDLKDPNADRNLYSYKVRNVMAPYDVFDVIEDTLVAKDLTYFVPANSGVIIDGSGKEIKTT